jgi:hypothetical protein
MIVHLGMGMSMHSCSRSEAGAAPIGVPASSKDMNARQRQGQRIMMMHLGISVFHATHPSKEWLLLNNFLGCFIIVK